MEIDKIHRKLSDLSLIHICTWIFDGEKARTQTPLNAIKEMVGDKVHVIYEPGLAYSREKNPTWFFINAIKGDITIAVPSMIRDGN